MTTPVADLVAPSLALAEEPARWNVRLLGRFQLADHRCVHTRLPSRAVTALLARLALWPRRDHAREELAELLWPGVDAGIGRRRLRHTLSLLKDVLEPAETGAAPVLRADRTSVRVVPGALRCDVHQFERAAQAQQPAAALGHYAGDLLPGFYDEWILDERQRLANLHESLLAGSAPPRTAAALPSTVPATMPSTAARGAEPAMPEAGTTEAAARPVAGPQRTDRSTLPVFLTRYLPDDAQIARLAARLEAHRWVTLVGPGGSGKTRLAVELARRMHGEHPPEPSRGGEAAGAGSRFDRVVFVPLVGVSTAHDVLRALARALRVDAPNPSFDGLVARLAGWRTLLVLDNAEQLAGVADDLWPRLTAASPSLHLLLTSRRSFGGEGEQLFAIAPLGLPAADASVQAVASSAAVALFVDRAAAVRAGFDVGPRNHAVLAALVVALEGMPLAIELAASRLRTVAPSEMLKRLRAGPVGPDRAAGHTPALDLLARSGARSAGDPRHASMLRTVEWSWRQLDAPQRELAGAMTVFAGGCSLEMLQHVAGVETDVAYVLDDLLAHSLAHAITVSPAGSSKARQAQAGGGPGGAIEHDLGDDADDDDTRRFRLYEPVREYAASQFGAERTATWRARHRAWAIAWARAMPATPSLPEVRAHVPNLAAAFGSAAADDAGEDAAALLLALGHTLEDVELPLAALDDASIAVDACRDPVLRARGHAAIAPPLHTAGRKAAALRHAELGVEGAPDDPGLRAHALYMLARTRWRSDMQHPERVLPLIDQAEALVAGGDRALAGPGDHYVLAGLLSLRTFVTKALGATPQAGLALQRRALHHWRAFGNRHAENMGRYNVAIHVYWCGDVAGAIADFDGIAAEARVLHDWRRLTVVNDALGTMLAALRRWPEAKRAYLEALDLGWRSMSVYNLSYVFWNLPRTLAHLRRPETALRLMAFAEVFYVEHVGVLTSTDQRDLLCIRRLAARQLSPRACAEAWAHGRLLTLAEAMALATAG